MADQPENVIYSGTLPGPTGDVPTILGATDINIQKQRAIDLYQFLVGNNRDLLQINNDAEPRTCLIGLPSSSKVRVLYCMGVGSSSIGAISAIDNQLLFLSGDGNADIGPPSPILLPTTAADTREVLTMTVDKFNTALTTKGADYSWPLVKRSDAANDNNTVNVMQIAPIPSFLILDGFHQDIDAAELIERIRSLDDNDGEMLQHAINFLAACLTGHNIGDNTSRLSQNVLINPIPPEARRWAKDKFSKAFPTLHPQTLATPPTDIAALLAHFANNPPPTTNRPAMQTIQNEEKKDEDETVLGMSKLEFDSTLAMCGLPPESDPNLLPEWFTQCAEKGMTEHYRMTVIRSHITNNQVYEDSEVPLTSTLLKMASKRNWTGKEGNINRPSFINATDGLSPFMLLDLTEDEVADINNEDDVLTRASVVTVNDLKAVKKRIQASIPTTSEKFMLLLQRYANLLFALFSETCPLYRCLRRIITAIKDYSRNARENFSKATKASILWVLLKQSRQFSIGETTVLMEFDALQRDLSSKYSQFHHAETPFQLTEETPPKPNPQPPKRPIFEPPPNKYKKQRPTPPYGNNPPPINNPNTWHPKLREKLGPQLKSAQYPTFMNIMRYCGTNAEDVYSRWSNKCAPNAFFGRCQKGMSCRKSHTVASDNDIEKILELTKKFRLNPQGITQG
jgi:hypothetical protein